MASRKIPGKRAKGYLQRKVNSREIRERFLIFCEGTKTEPYYFKSFRVNTEIVEVEIQGKGYNTLSLVREALDQKAYDEYDQVWCVFDRDSFTAQDFNAAFELANKQGIKIAYSNQAFELWYLLHFNFYDTAIQRHEYCKMLTELLGYEYKKNSKTIYDELFDRQPRALQNAQKLYAQYRPCNPEKDNPSTTVHLLVIELNKFLI